MMSRAATPPAKVAKDPLRKQVARALDRLASLQQAGGGWPYEAAQAAEFTEPTCWAMLALLSAGRQVPTRGLAYLQRVRTPDGGFHAGTVNREPNWCTALAVLTLARCDGNAESAENGVRWLLDFEGRHWKKEPDSVFGHDPELRGWPWLAGAHAWIEPTCYAVFAARATGNQNHPRVAEATRMILDRAIPSGGWNYGNTTVLGTELRPFPSTTAMALLALSSLPDAPEVHRGLAYLADALPRLKTPWALGWTLLAGRTLGFERLGLASSEADSLISRCLQRHLESDALRVHDLAVLLLASQEAGPSVFAVGRSAPRSQSHA